MMAAPAAAQRLPGTVVPEHYTLALEPDLAKETFRGRESIRVTLTEPGTSITLHAAEIAFGEVTITSGGLGTANLPYMIYQTFYQAHEYGEASAAGVIVVAGSIVIATFALRVVSSLFKEAK